MSWTVARQARVHSLDGCDISEVWPWDTIRTAAVGSQYPGELASRDHVFPVRAASGGLLERQGRIEAAVDAVRLAGKRPAAGICDLLDDAGGLGGLDTAVAVSERLGPARVAIADLAELRFERLWEGS